MAKPTRGFKKVRKHLEDKNGGLRSVRNCESCESYGVGEVCTDSGVTSFDMTVEEHKMYCSYWKPINFKPSSD